MNASIKKEIVDETILLKSRRLAQNTPELKNEISRQLNESIALLHLVDYSSRDDYTQTNATDLRSVSRIDVSTSLRLVQHHRTVIHHLCRINRSHLRLTPQAEQQRHLILVARDEYYLLDLASQTLNKSTNRYNIQQRHDDTMKRERHSIPHQPFDYAKYRRDTEQQQRILEQHCRSIRTGPSLRTPPSSVPSGSEFYLGRTILIT